MKQTIFVIVTITLILSACTSPVIIAPTETAVMTATPAPPTQTSIPPTPTQIPATATPEGVEWITVENIEDYANNPLNDEDMEPGGRVDQHLAEIKPELMEETNWDIIKDDIPFTLSRGALMYRSGDGNEVKFVNPELNPSVPDTNPFDRDIDAFGLYTAGNGRKYIFIPLVIRDIDAPTETGHDLYFIKLLFPLQRDDGTPLTQSELDYRFENWNNRMNIAPIGFTNQPMGRIYAFEDVTDDEDPTFDHLKEESPEFEIWFPAYLELIRGEPVHGPLSEFKKLESFLFPTQAHNLTRADGSPSNNLK